MACGLLAQGWCWIILCFVLLRQPIPNISLFSEIDFVTKVLTESNAFRVYESIFSTAPVTQLLLPLSNAGSAAIRAALGPKRFFVRIQNRWQRSERGSRPMAVTLDDNELTLSRRSLLR